MNILFLTYQGDVAGSTNSIIYLTTGLAKKGHRVFVGCRRESMLFHILQGSPVQTIPMVFRSKADIKNIQHIKSIVEQHDIRIINAQSGKDRYTSILAKWFYGLPVRIVHTRRQESKSLGGLQSLFYRYGTDKIVAVSDEIKRSLISKGIHRDHIKVIYNGTPSEKYDRIDQNMVEKLRLKFNIRDNDFVIGCVSRMKKQVQIILALSQLAFKVKVIFLGIEEHQLDAEILRSCKARHDVFFEGIVDSEHTLAYFKLFNLKILASTMEGLSQALLEAMYLKVPVIATAASGNLDLIDHGYNGLLFKDGDIETLAQHIMDIYYRGVDYSGMVERSHELVLRRFMIDRTIRDYELFFESLLAPSKGELLMASNI